jgi:uncharacterized delta-60 repeat protein
VRPTRLTLRRRSLLGVASAAVLLAVLIPAALAAPGDLDGTFGSGGKTTISFPDSSDAWAVARQPNGKLVVAGEASSADGSDFGVARVNANGAPDTSFGTGGKTTVDFGGQDIAFATALQPDGKIVLAGQTTAGTGSQHFAIARLNADGTPDASFGTGGQTTVDFGGAATDVFVDSTGRILVTGSTSPDGTQHDFAATRLNADGTPDASFGTGGRTTVDFGGNDRVSGAAVLGDGRILLAGDTTSAAGAEDFAVARLTAAGAIDSSFGGSGNGTRTIDFGGNDGASAVVPLADGKLILAGDTTAGKSGGDLAIARLTSGGGLDTAFGKGGKATIDLGGRDIGRAAAPGPNDGAVIAGAALKGTAQNFTVARVNGKGALDTGFGTKGKVTIAFADGGVAHTLLTQPDDKLVVAGAGGGQFGLARLSAGGLGPLPPANPPHCGAGVLARVHGQWRCAKVSGIDDGLTPPASSVPGFKSAGHGTSVARGALGVKVSKALKGAHAQGTAFRSGRRRLSFGVLTFASTGKAASALKGLAHKRRRVKLLSGLTGRLGSHVTKKATDVVVVFRVGRTIGAVRLRASGRVPGASTKTVAYAKALARRLRRVLSLSAWVRVTDGIGANGSITPKLALRAFAATYGALPGVPRPAGPRGALSSGDGAIQMVFRVWSRLSAAQHRAIDSRLSLAGGASASRAARAAKQVLTPDAALQAIADKYNAVYRAKLPSAAPVTPKVFKASESLGRGLMDSLPVNAQDQTDLTPGAPCRVRVDPSVQGNGLESLDRLIAHELFHCYQFALTSKWPQIKGWVMDGTAEWAAETVTGGKDIGWLPEYMSTPTRPLFSRTYDALGFWGHADETGGAGSLWAKIPGILGTSDDATAYALAGGTTGSFIDTWASATWRLPSAGTAWKQTDPATLGFNNPTVPFDVVTGSATLKSAPYAMKEYLAVADPSQPLVEVHGNEQTRGATSHQDFGNLFGEKWFCMGSCTCPPDEEEVKIPLHTDLGAEALDLAVTGGAAAGQGQIAYHSMEEFCRKKPDTGGGGGSGGGTGGNGPGIKVFRTSSESGLTYLGSITTGSCRFSGGAFVARGSGGGFKMTLRVGGAKKPGTYTIPYSSGSTYVTVNGYSSKFGGRGAAGGAVKIVRVIVKKKVRYRISLGYDPLIDAGASSGIVLVPGAGGLLC